MKQFISKHIFAFAIGTHIIARILFSHEISDNKIDLATAYLADEENAQQTIIDNEMSKEISFAATLTAILD